VCARANEKCKIVIESEYLGGVVAGTAQPLPLPLPNQNGLMELWLALGLHNGSLIRRVSVERLQKL
jgi:hypothetical protein